MRFSIIQSALIASFCASPFQLLAQTHEDETEAQFREDLISHSEVERIEVKGLRERNSLLIDLEQIQLQQNNSLFELFKGESSINLGGGGASNAKRIYVRGLESSTLNISLDGASQGTNVFQHRGNELGIDPDILKVVQVQTAPDASKPSSLGGSVEMTTKEAADFVKNDESLGAIVKLGYNTNMDSRLGSLSAYSFFNDNFSSVFSVSAINNENYKDGNNDEMLGTAYKDRNYFLKFNANDLGNHNLALSFNRNSNGGDMQWGSAGSDQSPVVDPSLLEGIVSTTTNYVLQHNYSVVRFMYLDTDINYTNISVDRKDQDLEYTNEKIGVTVQNHFVFSTDLSNNEISVGFQLEEEEGTGEFFCSPRNNGSDCAVASYAPTSTQNVALFMQGSTLIHSLGIRYGVRIDDYEFETGFGKATDDTVSPNIGLDYSLNNNSNIHANYGESSRMTGTIPFTWMTNIKVDTTYSSELSVESSRRYELGYNLTQNDAFKSGDFFRLETSVFKTSIRDTIVAKDINCNALTGLCGSGEGGRTLQDIYNSENEFDSEGFVINANYYYESYYASVSYTQINTNSENDDSGLVSGVNEQLAIRRVGGYDSKGIVFNAGMEVIEGLTVDYVLTAVDGIDNEQLVRGGYAVHDVSLK